MIGPDSLDSTGVDRDDSPCEIDGDGTKRAKMRIDGLAVGTHRGVFAGRPRGRHDLRDRHSGSGARRPVWGDAQGTDPSGLEIIIAAIEALGGKASDVVRIRIYLTDITNWREAGEIHGEFFESIRPATTLVQVARLIDPEAMVEIEADAVIHHEPSERLA